MRKYSEACEQNKDPILEVLRVVFNDVNNVLEVASGTGQHAAYFAKHLEKVIWQASDLKKNLQSIEYWISEERLENLLPPIELNIDKLPWPINQADAIFSANSFHIISMKTINNFFAGVSDTLSERGKLAVYGPFSYAGKHISQSNQEFDLYLRGRNPNSGIKDFDEINAIANTQGLVFMQDYKMPVNNQILVWKRS